MSADHSHLCKIKKHHIKANFNRNQITLCLRNIAENKKYKLSESEAEDAFITTVLKLPFLTAGEKRLFCLELYFLMSDHRFQNIGRSEHLDLLLALHRPHHTIDGLENLLIPLALKETKGRTFHPLLAEVLEQSAQIPARWTLILRLLSKEIPIFDVLQLTQRSSLLRSYQLAKVHLLKPDQIKILIYFLKVCKKEDRALFPLIFYLIEQAQSTGAQKGSTSLLIREFIWGVLPFAEKRLSNFQASFFKKTAKKPLDYGAKKAYALFYLWIACRYPDYLSVFTEFTKGLSKELFAGYAVYNDFRKRRFEEIIRYLPIRCLWNAAVLAEQNLELLLHLGAGRNIRSFSRLYLPINKKIAHAFHQLPPDDDAEEKDLNQSLRQIYWQYLGINKLPLNILETYIPFRWIRIKRQNNYYSRLGPRAFQFQRWENILKKMVWLSEHDPAYDLLEPQEIALLFNYFQHLIDENASFRGKGATIQSLVRRSRDWRSAQQTLRLYSRSPASANSWIGAPYKGFEIQKDGVFYQIVQLVTAKELWHEGRQMKHCVAMYQGRCSRGQCSIWSLQKQVKTDFFKSLATIEINQRHCIVQIKAKMNATPLLEHLEIIGEWAKREKLDR